MCIDDFEEPSPFIKKVLKGSLFAIVFAILGCIFIPSQKNLLIIYGVGGTIDYLKDNKNANKIPDKCVPAQKAKRRELARQNAAHDKKYGSASRRGMDASHTKSGIRYKPSSVNRGSKTDMAGDRRARGGR